jgi:hypothetical protein
LPEARLAQWVRSLDLTTHESLSPIRRGIAPGFVYYTKGWTRLVAASDKVYQLLAHGRWFSPGTPASYTTKTGRHATADILLKVSLKHQIIKSLNFAVAEQIIKRARYGMSLTGSSPSDFCARSVPGTRFSTSFVVDFVYPMIWGEGDWSFF